jgi:ABC-type glycerol-3-phosphate transport system substrate-binding protein
MYNLLTARNECSKTQCTPAAHRTACKTTRRPAAALSVLLCLLCLSLLFGCSEKAPAEPGPKDCIYKFSEFIPEGENYDILADVAFDGEMIYMLTVKTEAGESGTLENTHLIKTDLSGEVSEKHLLSSVTEDQMANMDYTLYIGLCTGSDGQIYLISQTFGNFTSAEGITAPGIETAIVLRSGGTETVLADVSGTLAPLGIDSSTLYVTDFEVDEKGIANLTVNMDSVWSFNLKNGELVRDNEPEEVVINSNIAKGDSKYDYYEYSLSSIYGCSGDSRTLVADLSASGVNLAMITRVIAVSDTQFLITGYKADRIGFDKLYMLTKIDPKDVPDKSVITVAGIEQPYYLPGYLTEFAAAHPEYQVDFKLYTYDKDSSFEDALNQFNNDIMAGNVPDVIIISSVMPYNSYALKGIFTDLYQLMDKDTEISRDDFYQPFLEALETDGKLYSIAPAFQIYTLVGKTSIFGEKQGQSFAELEEAALAIPGASLFGDIDRNYFMDGVFKRAASCFIDNENGICSFESPAFIKMLEFAKSLPESAPDAEPFMYGFWMPDETGDYEKNRSLIQLKNFFGFRDIVSTEKIDFGESVTFLGFPNASGGSGVIARTRFETAITASAKNPEGAWAFVKGLQSYNDSFTRSIGYPTFGNFPILKEELDNAAKNAAIPPFQYDQSTGERVPRKNWLGYDLSNQPDNTEADNAKMYALFESIDNIDRTVPAIDNIIAEETAAYFAGNKSAEETAKIIQNRATTYLEEQK